MIEGLDHLILNVEDIDVAEAEFSKAGFTVIRRPDVPKPTTASRFIVFPDRTYIMLIAVTPEGRSSHRLGAMLGKGTGWADYSLHLDDMHAEMARLGAAGVTLKGPKRGEHKQTDGSAWACDLLFLGRDAGASYALPFLVADASDRKLRAPGEGDSLIHRNGATGIGGLTIVTAEEAAVSHTLDTVLGSHTKAQRNPGEAFRNTYRVDSLTINHIGPDDTASPLREHLARRGESLYMVAFAGADGTAGTAEPMLVQGAQFIVDR